MTRRWVKGWGVGCVLAACSAGETPRHPTSVTPSPNAPAAVASSDSDTTAPKPTPIDGAPSGADSHTTAAPGSAPSASPSTSAAATAGPPDVAQTYAFDDYYPKAAAFSLLQHKRAHRLLGPTFEQRCWDLGQRVGVPTASGLLCLTDNRNPPFTLARIYRLEGNRLRQVWQAVVHTYANWLELTPVLSDDGGLVLHDRSPGSCEGALGEYHAKLDAMKAPPSGELLGPACAKRGKYSYEQRQYRLSEPVRRRDFPW